MKKNKYPQYKFNAEVTVGNCLRSLDHPLIGVRNDKKYCTDVCKVQESNERKEKGFTKLAFKGTKEELYELFNLKQIPESLKAVVQINFQKDLSLIKRAIESNDKSKSWKAIFDDFILYHIAHNKKRPFEIYCTEKKFKWLP